MAQGPSFMDVLKKHDSEFFDLVSAVEAKALGPCALDRKTKTLILLAIMAVGGYPEPVKHLAAGAKSLGATEQEIIETIRLAFLNGGVPGLSSGLSAFQK